MSRGQRPTRVIIDLDTLVSNYRAARDFIGDHLKYLAVVKADAYGHGAVECARKLETESIDWFGVALPEEGIELRKGGITTPILCLGSFWGGQETSIVDHRITPAIFDLETARSLNLLGEQRNIVVDVHVKIDTGMRRLGVDFGEADIFALELRSFQNLRVSGMLTHFAASDDPNETSFTATQIQRFEKSVADFRHAGHDPEYIDLANSSGAIMHPSARGNMVRLGGVLYGLLDDILPAGTETPELRSMLSLRSNISYIRSVPAGESIGYGRSFVTERTSQIALIPLGYADGLPRSLSNCGSAIVGDQIVPIVGRVSMDWTAIDVTDIERVAVNDEVYLIGSTQNCSIKPTDIATIANTIGYEITCGISDRVPRYFLGAIEHKS